MKKIIITLLFLCPFITGCGNVSANLDFLNKNTVLFSANLDTDKDVAKDEILLIRNNYKQFLDDDYITDIAFSNDSAKIEAVKLSKDIKRKDLDLSSIGFKSNLKSGRFIEVKHNIFITSFNVDLTYDLSSQTKKITAPVIGENKSQVGGLKPEYLQKYGDTQISFDDAQGSINEDLSNNLDGEYADKNIINEELEQEDDISISKEATDKNDVFNPQFSITLPSLASYNNADNVINKTYYWTIRKDSPTNIKLQYVIYNGFTIALLIFVVFGILFLLAKKILKHDAQKRVGANN